MRSLARWLAIGTGIVLLSAGDGLAQSTFRDRGESGASGIASFFTTDGASGLGVDGLWTGWGVLDLGIGYARTSFEPDGSVQGYTGHQVGLQAAYLPLKQGGRVPLNVQIGGGYALLSYTGDLVGDYDVDGTLPTVGATISRAFTLTPNLRFVPFGGFAYSRADITYDLDGARVSEEKRHIRAWSVGGSLLIPRETSITVKAELSDDSQATYSLAVGFLFPHPRP